MPTTAVATSTGSRNGRTDDTAYLDLRDRIVSGKLPPGARLSESTLVERLGVNRYAVRSAIEKLEHEGLVTRLPGGRARWEISALTVADFREVSGIMGSLHAYAAGLVADLEDDTRLQLVSELYAINGELREVVESQPLDRTRAAQLDNRFHRRIIDAVAGPRLSAILKSQEPVVERYSRSYLVFMPPSIAASVDEHDAMMGLAASGLEVVRAAQEEALGERLVL